MILYRQKGLRIGEYFFDHPVENDGCDIAEYHYRTAPLTGSLWRYSFTHLIDLYAPFEEICSRFHNNTAYEIKRARQRDNLDIHHCDAPSSTDLEQFFDFFDHFAKAKGLEAIDRTPLRLMHASAALSLTTAVSATGEKLVMHCYHTDRTCSRALLLHSASVLYDSPDNELRKVTGRANRLLHANDMQLYKKQGFRLYDFGGFYIGSTDHSLLQINRFKESFGGVLTPFYSGRIGLTIAGRTYLMLTDIRDRLVRPGLVRDRRRKRLDGDEQMKIFAATSTDTGLPQPP